MATAKYDRENTRCISLKLNKKSDADIIEHLENQSNMQGYIKRIIREDIYPDRKLDGATWENYQKFLAQQQQNTAASK